MMRNYNTMIIGLMVGFLMMSVSCSSTLFNYQDTVVKEEFRIALERDGAGEGAWETRDVSLRCQYKESDGRLELTGEVRIADHLRNSYDVVEFFHLTLLFLDAEGRVVGSKRHSLAPFRKDTWEYPIKWSVDAPENARAISFGYNGKAVSFTPRDARPFFKLPFE